MLVRTADEQAADMARACTLAMALHPRLGAASPLAWLHSDLVRRIASFSRLSHSRRLVAIHVRAGLRLGFLSPSLPSGDLVLDSMRQSSGGSAILAAIALCRAPVDVYGVGLFAEHGAASDKLYGHSYDHGGIGLCVPLSKALRFTKQTEEGFQRQRWATKARRRDQRMQGEVLLHLLDALGIIRWHQ